MAAVQGLSDHDVANRCTVAERLIGILSDDVIILMTAEAQFHLSGCVNKQNVRCWAEENPQQLHQRPLHNARVTVCCGVANFGVTGPYFLEDEDGRAVTVTFARCVEMLRNFLTTVLSRRGTELSTIQFQQDGATTHQREHPWELFGKYFRSTLFHCAASFHGLQVRLISLL
jgi:hypothetical protein